MLDLRERQFSKSAVTSPTCDQLSDARRVTGRRVTPHVRVIARRFDVPSGELSVTFIDEGQGRLNASRYTDR